MAYSLTDGSATSGPASSVSETAAAANLSLTENADAWLNGLRARVGTRGTEGSLTSIENMIFGGLVADPPDAHRTLWMRLHDRPIGRLSVGLEHCKPTPTGVREILMRLELLRETTFFLTGLSLEHVYPVAIEGEAQQLFDRVELLNKHLAALWAEYDEGERLLDTFDDESNRWIDGGKLVQDLLAALKKSTDALEKSLTLLSYDQPPQVAPAWAADSPFTLDVFLSFLSPRHRVLTRKLMSGEMNADSVEDFTDLTGAWDDAFQSGLIIAKAKHQPLRAYEVGAQRIDLKGLVTQYVPRR